MRTGVIGKRFQHTDDPQRQLPIDRQKSFAGGARDANFVAGHWPAASVRTDQRLYLGQGLSWFGAPLLGDVSIEQVFPERTVATKVYHHGLSAAPSIDNELDAWHFLE